MIILRQETFDKFGYYPEDLTSSSKNKIICKCEYCGENFEPTKQAIKVSLEKYPEVPKSCCRHCCLAKSKEVHKIRGTWEKIQAQRLESTKRNNLAKHGVEFNNQRPEVKEKARKTRENYTPERKAEIQKAKEDGMMKNHGVTCSFKSKEIMAKVIVTLMQRYNVPNPLMSPEIREKAADTMELRYGVRQIMFNDFYKNKAIQNQQAAIFKSHKVKSIWSLPEFHAKTIITRAERGNVTLYNGKTINQWAAELNTTYDILYSIVQAQGIDGLINFNKSDSYTSIEYLIAGVLEKYNINFIYDKYLGKNRFDFKIDSHKLIIEACGNWWHCDGWIEKRYHQQKRYNYLNNGYSSLFFWESEIIQKAAIVESIIKERLGMNELLTLDAFNIEEIETGVFFQNNSLLTSEGKHKLGLIVNREILAAIEFDLYDKIIIIRRAASKLGVFIPEMISQFINYLTLTYDLNKIIYYVDFRIENEDLLLMNGFEYRGEFLDYMKTDLKNIFDKKEVINGRQHKLWNAGLGKFELLLKQS